MSRGNTAQCSSLIQQLGLSIGPPEPWNFSFKTDALVVSKPFLASNEAEVHFGDLSGLSDHLACLGFGYL